jgi:hypothetical protein
MSDHRLKCDRVDVGYGENVKFEDLPNPETSKRPLALDSAECRKQITWISYMAFLPYLELPTFGWYPENFPLHAHTVHTFSGRSSPALQETRTNSRPAPGQSSPSLIAPEAGYQAEASRSPRQQTLGSAGLESSRYKVDIISLVNSLDTAIHGILAATRPLSGLCHQGCRQAEVTGLLRLEF